METMRSFVAALCGVKPVEAERLSIGEPFHIIPDPAAGSGELARVRVSRPPTDPTISYAYQYPDMRTDFYEFYFADLLSGTTFANLRVWAQSVMFRWPHQVPRPLGALWATLWLVVVALAAYIGTELDGQVWSRLTSFLTSGLRTGAPGPTPTQLLLLILVCAALGWRLWQAARTHVDGNATHPSEIRTLAVNLSYAAALLLPLILGCFAYNVFPWRELAWSSVNCIDDGFWRSAWCVTVSFINQAWIKLLVGACVWWAATHFGVAYFGDVARYLHMSPDAVASRAAVRERGLKLFTDLSEKRAIVDGSATESPEYVRIVVVAHSLGSVIAYDVLRLLWGRDNANANKALPAAALTSMKAMVALAQANAGKDRAAPTDRGKLIELQRAVSANLAGEPHGWRFSDFISLGSPLALGDFLLARDWPRFKQSVAERSLPICPPLLEKSNNSFLYSGGTVPGEAPHHAAMFSAVRWTAIFDPYFYPMNGDFIGGPVTPLYGWGATEVAARITRNRMFLPRLFTHTDYWDDRVTAALQDACNLPDDIKQAGAEKQAVLGLLRRLIWPEKVSMPVLSP